MGCGSSTAAEVASPNTHSAVERLSASNPGFSDSAPTAVPSTVISTAISDGKSGEKGGSTNNLKGAIEIEKPPSDGANLNNNGVRRKSVDESDYVSYVLHVETSDSFFSGTDTDVCALVNFNLGGDNNNGNDDDNDNVITREVVLSGRATISRSPSVTVGSSTSLTGYGLHSTSSVGAHGNADNDIITDTLERGQVDEFEFKGPVVSIPPRIELTVRGSRGFSPSWCVSRISVTPKDNPKGGVSYPLPGRGSNGLWMKGRRARVSLEPAAGDRVFAVSSKKERESTSSTSSSPSPSSGFTEEKSAISNARRLSLPREHMSPEYDVVVVGSGYGASVAASRFARAGLSVCVLERGREFTPGDFPSTGPAALAESRARVKSGSRAGALESIIPSGAVGRENGLYHFDVFDDLLVVTGCGLGGTSLINAGVTLECDKRVYEDRDAWPSQFLEMVDSGEIARETTKARGRLEVEAYPEDEYPTLDKASRLKTCASAVGGDFVRVPIAVTFADRVNPQGVAQPACNNCGDCCTGCNYGSKNTLPTTYIADAVNFGAEVYCECDVLRVRKRSSQRKGDVDNDDGGGGGEGDGGADVVYTVEYTELNSGFSAFGNTPLSVRARHVVLGAGSLGSTEIMFRSKESGLQVSDTLGERFSGNGDALALSFNGEERVNSLGLGAQDPTLIAGPGPTITSMIDLRRADRPLDEGFVVEDGSPPGAFVGAYAKLLLAASPLVGIDMDSGIRDKAKEVVAYAKSFIHGAYEPNGAMMRTQSHLVMSQDSASGVIRFDSSLSGGKGDVVITWPGCSDQPNYERVDEVLQRCSKQLGATHVKTPNWFPKAAATAKALTVHPLGGCPMGNDASSGVVDAYGRVFDTSDVNESNDDVHEGLMIVDASIIPRSVGVNPLLTITAIAEMCVSRALERMGKTAVEGPREIADIEDAHKIREDIQRSNAAKLQQRVGMTFTESMVGYISETAAVPNFASHSGAAAISSFEACRDGGKAKNGHGLRFVLSVTTRDLNTMIDGDISHSASLHGYVTCPLLSPEPLSVHRGSFHMFTAQVPTDPPHTRRMTYRFYAAAPGTGVTFRIDGYKLMHDDDGFDAWKDTTTLFVSVYKEDEEGDGNGNDDHSSNSKSSKKNSNAANKKRPAAKRKAGRVNPAKLMSEQRRKKAEVPIYAGVLRIKPTDFARQLATMKILDAKNAVDRIVYLSKFLYFFTANIANIFLRVPKWVPGADADTPVADSAKEMVSKQLGRPDVRTRGARRAAERNLTYRERVSLATGPIHEKVIVDCGVDIVSGGEPHTIHPKLYAIPVNETTIARWKIKGGNGNLPPVVVIPPGCVVADSLADVMPCVSSLVGKGYETTVLIAGQPQVAVAKSLALARASGSTASQVIIIAASLSEVSTMAMLIEVRKLPSKIVSRIFQAEGEPFAHKDAAGVPVTVVKGSFSDHSTFSKIKHV